MGMSTKQYLSQIERLDRMIQNKLTELYQLKQMATSITVKPKEVNVQTTPVPDRLGEAVAKIIDLENETDRLVDEYIDKRKRIVSQIEGLANTNMYHVLFLRYVARKSWKDVLKEFNDEKFTFRNLMYLHKNALKEFEKLYGDEYLT